MNIEKQILQWFEYFHENPEVSWQEVRSTAKIAEILNGLGVRYRTFPDITGLIAEIGKGDDVIAVRADMDALCQEVNGVYQANHSCGHDAHMAIVLGTLLYLHDHPLNKRVRFIFQPAEEKGGGAIEMVKRGVLNEVTHLFGIHLRPIEELPLGKISPSIQHGACVFMEGKIMGTDAHGARPHQGNNAIDAIAALYQYMKSIYHSPFEPYSAKITKIISGGENVNIIPGTAEFALDVRAQKNTVLYNLQKKIEQGLKQLSILFGISIEYDWYDFTPGAEISKEAEKAASEAIISVAGEHALAPSVITPGSDDFHFYTIEHPDVKATMIGLGADLKPGLHHPMMSFNKSALMMGAKVLAETVKKVLND
ncbi:amidohydrolase [Siminovitchia sp. 179-K 8D1 HS]|uniref:amidohydrolase n=1 Tax=Siminovitchia sp. 179-K 8D1 HS TaxID=3142385 RepID=UPI0039A3914B